MTGAARYAFLAAPVVAFAALYAILAARGAGRRQALLGAMLGLGTALALLVELLSVWPGLSRGSLAAGWACVAVALVVLRVARRPAAGQAGVVREPAERSGLGAALGGVALVLVLTAVTALAAPPNTWDSMTYHLSRVVHWMQDRSVEHYPTHIIRQLFLAPWAEFAVLHLQLLTGSDRLANLVQWLSMTGSLVAVSLIAGKLGAGALGQALAVVVAVTIPMGILQATSTQNDYAVTFWLLLYAYYMLVLLEAPAGPLRPAVATAAGLALGLAIMTKGTAYVFAAPIGLGLAATRGRAAITRNLAVVSAVALFALAMNLGPYVRNARLFGSPLGPVDGRDPDTPALTSAVFSPAAVLSSSLRNLGLHLGTPSGALTRAVERAITGLHRVLGIDENDPRTTWPSTRFAVPRLSTDEDYAGNLVHTGLVAVTAVLLLARRRSPWGNDRFAFATCLAVGGLLFVALLRWQPWHARLHLPLFVLAAPLVGACLADVLSSRAARTLAVLLLLASSPWVLLNATRPLVGPKSVFVVERAQQYFAKRQELFTPYLAAVRDLHARRCRDVGLVIGANGWEYPIWSLARGTAGLAVRLEHVGVRNVSARLVDPAVRASTQPCALLVVREGAGLAPGDALRGVLEPVAEYGPISVYAEGRGSVPTGPR